MSGPRNVDRGSYWGSVFQKYADSGLSIRQFCQENGISQSTFFAWRKKLNEEPSLANNDRVRTSQVNPRGKRPAKQPAGVNHMSPVTRRNDQPTVNPGMSFVAVKLPAESEPVEVVHPLGYVLRIPGRANLDCLAQIFQILDRHAAK